MPPPIEVVVKIGGGLLSTKNCLEEVLGAVGRLRARRRVLVVPGGGPFADSVRTFDSGHQLAADAAHWMAILGMDQYAHFLVSRAPRATLVYRLADAEPALAEGLLPVLAPFQCLREADPLAHSWDVTSDSIAAWISSTVGARYLVLIKPAGASGPLVDAYFDRTLPETVKPVLIRADEVDKALHTL